MPCSVKPCIAMYVLVPTPMLLQVLISGLLAEPFACCLQLTTNLIKKAEEGVNGLIAKLGAPTDLSQHSPHASVQQLLHAGFSALCALQSRRCQHSHLLMLASQKL